MGKLHTRKYVVHAQGLFHQTVHLVHLRDSGFGPSVLIQGPLHFFAKRYQQGRRSGNMIQCMYECLAQVITTQLERNSNIVAYVGRCVGRGEDGQHECPYDRLHILASFDRFFGEPLKKVLLQAEMRINRGASRTTHRFIRVAILPICSGALHTFGY